MDEESMMSAYATCFTTNTLLWYSEALRSIGAVTESRRLVEALVRSSKHPGVLAEAIDLRSGEQWGNTPCTSALLSLLRVALRLTTTLEANVGTLRLRCKAIAAVLELVGRCLKGNCQFEPERSWYKDHNT